MTVEVLGLLFLSSNRVGHGRVLFTFLFILQSLPSPSVRKGKDSPSPEAASKSRYEVGYSYFPC